MNINILCTECEGTLREYLNELVREGYTRFYVGIDSYMSGWGLATGKNLLQINALKGDNFTVYETMKQDGVKHLKRCYVSDIDSIIKRSYGKMWQLHSNGWAYNIKGVL